MRRALIALAVLAVVLLTGCRDPDLVERERYTACLAAGGSYDSRSAGRGWSCEVPGD